VVGDALEASVGYLEPGSYTVRWGTYSDEDGHLVGGSYRFQVGPGRLAEMGGTGAALDRTLSIGSRLVLLAGAILWGGSLLLGWLLAPSSAAHPGLAGFDSRLRRVTGWAVLVTLVPGELASLLAAARSGLPVGTGDFFFGSTTGRLLTARICVLAAGVALSGWPRPGRGDRRTQLAFAVGYLGLLAFSGHARLAPAGPLSGPLFDGIHLLGASAWLGGIVLLGLGLPAATAGGGGLAEAARRFSPVALAAAAVLGITGVFATDQQLLSASDLSDSAYGRLLVIKLVLVAALVVMSAQVGFVLRPKLLGEDPGTGPGAAVASRLVRNLRAEAVVAAGIVACVALMTSRASPQVVAAGAVQGGGRAPDPVPVLVRQEREGRQVALSVVPGLRGRNRVIVTVDGEAVPDLGLRIDGPDRAGPGLRLPVVAGASTAEVDFPSAGDWRARIAVAGEVVDFDFTVGELRPGGGFEVLSVADLSGPGREACRQELLGRQVALSGADEPPVHLVVDAADFDESRIPGSPDVLLGGCGIDDGRLAELARERQIPLVGADTVAGGPYSWRLAPDPILEGEALARLSLETPGVASSAVAFEGAEGSAAAVAFADRFSRSGGTVAGTWDLGSSPPGAVASQMVPLRVDLLVLFGSIRGTTALARDLDGRGWRPAKTVLGASSFFGPELLDAAPGWSRQGITNVAGYHELDVKMVSPFVRGLLGAFPGEQPSLRGFAGFLEGRLLLDAMAGVEPGRADPENLVGALDKGFRRGWRPGAIDIAWQPGNHNGAGEVAIFQLTPALNMFGLLGGAHSGHEIGGLLYNGGDLQRITSFAGPAGPVRSEGGDPGP
jgi:copper transport protein